MQRLHAEWDFLEHLKKRWFIDHLNKKGIPYDDLVVNDVTGVTF